jgi:hypothetical protein
MAYRERGAMQSIRKCWQCHKQLSKNMSKKDFIALADAIRAQQHGIPAQRFNVESLGRGHCQSGGPLMDSLPLLFMAFTFASWGVAWLLDWAGLAIVAREPVPVREEVRARYRRLRGGR